MSRRSLLSSLLPPSPERIFRAQLDALREHEARHPYLPRFHESTLPAKLDGQSEIEWRHAQLDILQAWVRRMMKLVAEIETRARCSAALQNGGVS